MKPELRNSQNWEHVAITTRVKHEGNNTLSREPVGSE